MIMMIVMMTATMMITVTITTTTTIIMIIIIKVGMHNTRSTGLQWVATVLFIWEAKILINSKFVKAL